MGTCYPPSLVTRRSPLPPSPPSTLEGSCGVVRGPRRQRGGLSVDPPFPRRSRPREGDLRCSRSQGGVCRAPSGPTRTTPVPRLIPRFAPRRPGRPQPRARPSYPGRLPSPVLPGVVLALFTARLPARSRSPSGAGPARMGRDAAGLVVAAAAKCVSGAGRHGPGCSSAAAAGAGLRGRRRAERRCRARRGRRAGRRGGRQGLLRRGGRRAGVAGGGGPSSVAGGCRPGPGPGRAPHVPEGSGVRPKKIRG